MNRKLKMLQTIEKIGVLDKNKKSRGEGTSLCKLEGLGIK